MDEYYKCPEWITNKFTIKIMVEFKDKLCEVFHKSLNGATELTQFDVDGIVSTCGWSDAFNYICNKYDFQDVIDYQSKLEWFDWDIFADDIDDLLFEFEIVYRATEEEYAEYYGNYEDNDEE